MKHKIRSMNLKPSSAHL